MSDAPSDVGPAATRNDEAQGATSSGLQLAARKSR
jgi:hypothetical protein